MRLETDQPDICFSSKSVPCALCLVAKQILSLRHTMLIAVVVSLLTHLVPPLYAQQPLQFPPTPKKAVSDEYHGVKVSEDYRWLEDIYDPAVRRWIDEQNQFGTVKDPEQFRALYAYSPYHNVKNNTAYPAVLFLTGDNDGRVDPMQSRKM
ncbi:MAG TPA: prolyl oligopeptidase family serine peptidase, partial [Pyrinomonadaceae bacterium]|nr:prolyl oligopeptidase family serine peptidase [Pyrinomonadaceae bacterium]